jgi:hypothetical protein
MTHMLAGVAVISLSLALPGTASAQWQNNNLALKTNGSLFQPGDQLKVEIVALEQIVGPFATRVTYRYAGTVTVKDEKGGETVREEQQMRARPAGPFIELMNRFQVLVVDDTLHFGEDSPRGVYSIEVAVFAPDLGNRVATLRSCVVLAGGEELDRGCGLSLRGITRVNPGASIVFDGNFPAYGLYSALLVRDNRILGQLDASIVTIGPHELEVSTPALVRRSGFTFDILIHDQLTNASATLTKVTIPHPQ